MSYLTRLEKRFGKYAIKNITWYLIIGQFFVFLTIYAYPQLTPYLPLQGNQVLTGEWWRLISFLFLPLSESPLFVVLAWYVMYLYGTMLEREWGEFRYLLYLLVIYFATIVTAFLFPNLLLTNGAIFTSLFLAFAYLYPDYKLYIFFFIPLKIKWIAYLVWFGIGFTVIFADLGTKIVTLLSVSNFFIFFGRDIVTSSKRKSQSVTRTTTKRVIPQKAYHTCVICSENEVTNPGMEIRYCTSCIPSRCFCGKHITNHTHKKLPN